MENKNIYQKLLEAQKEIGAIKRDSDNPYFNSKYFDINAILAEVKPILNKHGLLLIQGLEMSDGKFGIRTSIIDPGSKDFISPFCEIPNLQDPQKQGSAITYFRRYALQSLLALEATDDDANLASGKEEGHKGKNKTALNNQKMDDFMESLPKN